VDGSVTRVTGIGGVFLKAKDPARMQAWYRTHLGIDVQVWGGATFRWNEPPAPHGATIWSLFPADTKYFGPGPQAFMVNYRVADLAALLATLRAEGCDVDPREESTEHGKFGWVIDPEGNRIELWEPPPGRYPG
jgi:predicted enzyme related to lactoylglutathione lyase